MSQQWGQGQPGYQYPMQTGFPAGQFQPGFASGVPQQQTGFPGQRLGFQQPQHTGFQQPQQPGYPQFQQQTGFQGGFQQQQPPPVPPLPSNMGGFQPPPPVPPVPPLPSNVGPNFRPTPQNSGFLQQQPPQQQNRFLNPSPGMGPTGLAPQMTGFQGGLVPQMTGFVDPRLQMMSSTFMPANPAAPYAGGMLQFAGGAGGAPQLQQSIQQYNQTQRGNVAPKMPWALSKAEKKNYDQIFRAWDAQSTGFISGQMALEVFGQSGLDKNDLAKIWALADGDNRGKLNLAEFHVAMGLIYRKLNGNDIPDVLPPELVPPSSRDLDTSVNFLKDILKNDNSRSISSSPVSRGKVRSFNDTYAPGAGGRKDATVYKHADDEGGLDYYQSRSRHIDRRAVRVGNETPTDELEDVKRQLENTQKMLDKAVEDSQDRNEEDEALDREMEDLRYRVKRVKEDLEYASRSPRSAAKDEERRRLERELLHMMHERVPEVEKKIEERDRRREREKREWTRDRDRRNERFGRYDDRDRDHDYSGRDGYDRRDRDRDHDDERDRGYNRGTFDREVDRDRDRDRPYSRNRSRDRDYSRRSPPPTVRSPAPPPPAAPPVDKNPPPAPKPALSPAPGAGSKPLTLEERREQARRRVEERMRALGVTVSPASQSIDTSVEDRLQREKEEAEAKARQAEKEAEERERTRKERLEGEKAMREGRTGASTPSPASATPAKVPPVLPTPAPAPAHRANPPPAPPKRAPAPPPPRKGAAARSPVTSQPAPIIRAPVPPAVPRPSAPTVAPPVPEEDPEEKRIREREEEIKKQREARAERLRQLEREEEEARRAEEEYQQRRAAYLNRSATPTPAAPASSVESIPPPQAPPPPPPPPVTTPSSVSATYTGEKSTNPFSRLMGQGATSGSSGTPAPVNSTNGSTNPFFKPSQTSATPSAPTPPPVPKSPAPPTKSTYNTAPAAGQSEDEWDEINEREEDSDSDDDIGSSRDARSKIAQQLFGGVMPARPQSAAGTGPGFTISSPGTPAPMSAPPTAPPAPPVPPVAQVAPPAVPAGRGALLNSIVSGRTLRKTVTNDRSAAAVTGAVIGDVAPPPHIGAAPRAVSPPPQTSPAPPPPAPPIADLDDREDMSVPLVRDGVSKSSYRQSVDWYAGLAADQGHIPVSNLPSTTEESEDESEYHSALPEIQIQEPAPDALDPMDDVDKSTLHRVRSLYPYQGQRLEDLSFTENLVITAHPSKSGGDWWYGTLVKDGKSGFFPSTYVQAMEQVEAVAVYSYEGGNVDELAFTETDVLTIVDRNEVDWWKAEKGGVIFIVPAAYLEITDG